MKMIGPDFPEIAGQRNRDIKGVTKITPGIFLGL
jgi:hypothetical protein